MSAPSPWILKHPVAPRARVRLLCFPFAGGGASAFRPWCELLAPDIEVVPIQLPGRENRLSEPALDTFTPMIAELRNLIESQIRAPFAFFGHSAGAHLAFLLAQDLRTAGLSMPAHMFLSSRRATHLPNATPLLAPLSDEDFLAEVMKRYGAEAQVKDMDLYQLMLPTIRADITATETHPFAQAEPLACPITVFGGEGDDWVPKASLEAWAAQTTAAFELKMFPGAHFYLNAARTKLLAHVRKSLLASL